MLRDCARVHLHCFRQGVQCVYRHVCNSHDTIVFDCDVAALAYGEEVRTSRTSKFLTAPIIVKV
jgi:hypothetical protein